MSLRPLPRSSGCQVGVLVTYPKSAILNDLPTRCKDCPLRGNPVQGTGPLDAQVLIIGEAPGADEARVGEPFVGKSGQFLRKWASEVGLDIDQCRIENVVRCRPPGNRTPTKDEINACKPLLFDIIDRIKPRVVVPLGNVPLEVIEGSTGVKARRGVPRKVGNFWSIPEIHPSWYLRQGQVGAEKFGNTLNTVKQFAYDSDLQIKYDYKILNNLTVLNTWYNELMCSDIRRLTVDIETQNKEFNTKFLGIGFSTGVGKGYFIPLFVSGFFKRRVVTEKKVISLANIEPFWHANQEKVYALISSILRHTRFKFSTFHGHFDLIRSRKTFGDSFDFAPSWVFDCFYAMYLLDENKMPGTRDLDTATMKYPDLAGYKKDSKNVDDFFDLPMEVVADRCIRDCDGTYRETVRLAKEIEDNDLNFLMYKFMMPVGKLFADMIEYGLFIDQEYLEKLGKELEAEIHSLDVQIYQLVGRSFNINSGDQLAKVIFEDLKVGTPTVFTEGGRPSVDADTLKVFRDTHPVIGLLQTRAKLVKSKSTYIDGYRDHILADGRIHANLRIAYGTRTGRPASKTPNLLNIDRKKSIRRIASAPKGKGLCIADVSQAEIRVLAVRSRDPLLIRAYQEGKDIHCYNVSVCFGMDYDKVVQLYKAGDQKITDLRTGMKHTLSFGALYGMGDESLAEEIIKPGESFQEAVARAKSYKKIWTKEFPDVERYKQYVYSWVKEHQYFRNVYGRYRRLPEAISSDKGEQAEALRQAFNFDIQSAASDMTLLYMVEIWEEIKRRGWKERVYPVLTVYDSVLFESDFELMLEVGEIYKEVFSKPPWEGFSIPVSIDIDYDKSWKVPIIYHLEEGCKEHKGDGHLISAPNTKIPERNWCQSCFERAYA